MTLCRALGVVLHGAVDSAEFATNGGDHQVPDAEISGAVIGIDSPGGLLGAQATGEEQKGGEATKRETAQHVVAILPVPACDRCDSRFGGIFEPAAAPLHRRPQISGGRS